MDQELSGKELAEAKKQARRLRIRNIRRRIAVGAAALVAVFSGMVLYRSWEQQVPVTQTSAVTQTEDDSSYLDQVTSFFSDDDHEDDDHESDDDHEYEGSSSSSSSSTSSSVPLVSSQS